MDAVEINAGAWYLRVPRADDRMDDRRRRFGLSELPSTAVVTSSGRSLDPSAPVLTDTVVPTIVLTCESVPADLRGRWADAGAEVVLTGDESVDLAVAVAALGERGLLRINCMGGPALFGSLAEAGLVDELRLTLAPFLVSGEAGRIARGAGMDPARLELVSVVTGDDTLLMRYRVREAPSS